MLIAMLTLVLLINRETTYEVLGLWAHPHIPISHYYLFQGAHKLAKLLRAGLCGDLKAIKLTGEYLSNETLSNFSIS